MTDSIKSNEKGVIQQREQQKSSQTSRKNNLKRNKTDLSHWGPTTKVIVQKIQEEFLRFSLRKNRIQDKIADKERGIKEKGIKSKRKYVRK